jgi:ATP-binding cassette subfamily G (WHITE) protein 2
VRVVAERAFWYKWRNPDAVMSQFVGSAVMAVIVGSVFWQLPLTGGGVRDRLSAISFILLTTSFVAFDQVLILPHERAVMLRDSAAGAYSTAAFFVGRTLAEAPVHSVFAVVTALVTQAMFGLRTDARATGVYVMVHLLVMHAGAALLTLVGALSKTMAMGNGLATIVIVFASLFNGFFIGPANIPLVYRWVADISFPSFGVRAATATELAGLTYACTPEEAAAGCTGVGDDVLASLGWGAVDAWQACGWLALETAVFRVLAFLALHFMYTGQPLRERARQLWHG